jgi:hypothetical protein
LSNYKLWATIGDGIGSSWRFFRARVDYLHVSNNASHIFFSVWYDTGIYNLSGLF